MLLLIVAFMAFAVPAAEAKAPSRAPLPEDVALGLADGGIVVADGPPGDGTMFPVTAAGAVRIAWRHFGGMAARYRFGLTRVGRTTVHLVRVVESDSVGPDGLFPGQVVWLVVIRDVNVPILGPPRKHRPPSYLASLAVFVRTDTARYALGASF